MREDEHEFSAQQDRRSTFLLVFHWKIPVHEKEEGVQREMLVTIYNIHIGGLGTCAPSTR